MKKIIATFLSAILLGGCTHSLDVRNLGLYQPSFVENHQLQSKIGIMSQTGSIEEERLISATADSLRKNGFQIIYPYYENSVSAIDYNIKISTDSKYDGSRWNFLINFPGFIVFAPAWHGYNYKAKYNFKIDIHDVKRNQSLPAIKIPVDLRFRHAALNRTWTGISWFEVGIIALIGGVVFVRYDRSVTPELIDKIEYKIGDYFGGNILKAINSMQAV